MYCTATYAHIQTMHKQLRAAATERFFCCTKSVVGSRIAIHFKNKDTQGNKDSSAEHITRIIKVSGRITHLRT